MENRNSKLTLSSCKHSAHYQIMYEENINMYILPKIVQFILHVYTCSSALPSAVQTLSPDALQLTNQILQKCQEYYKVSHINTAFCIKLCSWHVLMK